MEQIMMWVTIVGLIVYPIAGGIFNNIYTQKINDMNNATEKSNSRTTSLEDELEKKEEQMYRAINGQRSAFENRLKEYVRKDLYDQAIDLHRINNDEKFKSLLSIVTTQYTNLESKINENNINMNEKVSSLKTLINEKFKGI